MVVTGKKRPEANELLKLNLSFIYSVGFHSHSIPHSGRRPWMAFTTLM
ncbi:protein of unknown function [Pseudomonas sp. JV241A]|nr:protein of unknown function [Pseudomonas sp. JV241A]